MRLLAFGDSFTQGVGITIDDLRLGPMQYSRFSWPKVTADMLGCECVNYGEGGSAVKKIAYDIVNTHDIAPDDIVVVMWTSCMYRSFYLYEGHQYLIGQNTTESDNFIERKLAEAFYGHQADLDEVYFNAKAYVTLADNHLRQYTNNIIYVPVIAYKDCYKQIFDNAPIQTKMTYELELLDERITPVYGADGGHYSKQMHRHFSEQLSGYIQKNYLT